MASATRASTARSSRRQHTPDTTKQRGRPTATASTKIGSNSQIPVDLTEADTPSPSKKRKADSGWFAGSNPKKPAPESPPQKKRDTAAPPEKRLRRFRQEAPQSFFDVYQRAVTQRFYVLERRRTGTEECPEETVELTGSTGNIYTVTVGLRPQCDCPHAKKGNQCKHLVFVMNKVLNAPFDLTYQLALLSSELRDIFAMAPPVDPLQEKRDDNQDGDKRRPIEGDCPICFSELGEEREAVVWCRAACGQNIHQECFETWARTKGSGGEVTCPMCRSVWEGDTDIIGRVEKSRGTVSEGYINVADQLGISQVRDTSSYSEWFGRPRRGGSGQWEGWRGGWGRRYGVWGRR